MQCECGNICIVDGSTLKKRWQSCGCIRKQSLIGQQFGIGTVVKLLDTKITNNRVWEIECKCGKYYKATTNSLLFRNTKSCGCLNHRKGKSNPLYKGHEDITGDYWSKLRRGAEKRSINFEISIEYAWELFKQQNKQCALTGWGIQLGRWRFQTASLDRIDSSKGYMESNVQWVHKDINKMKQNFQEHYFISACKAITERSHH